MAKKLSSEQQAIISASDAGLHITTIELANKLLASEPDNLRVLLDLGHACWQIARYDEAETALNHAIEICEPEKRDAIFGELGNLHLARGDFQSAAKWFQQQIETDPNDANGYLFLGSLQMRSGDLASAQKTLKRGIECEYGVLDEVHLLLGLVHAAKKDYSAAQQHFKTATELEPQNVAAKTALKDVQRWASAMP